MPMTMTKQEALEKLDGMQSQIIHGSRIFSDIADVIRQQENVNDEAGELYDAACSLMRRRYVKNDDQWQNLENAARRYNAAKQATSNAALT